ncbi:MAG TPA: substrate-binding domain-containing protein, partial [Candidatus Limnocylindrales bacterium]|nr:substrate-binding domain-containing protein [Candidatus Limnocylindrales bacterium]
MDMKRAFGLVCATALVAVACGGPAVTQRASTGASQAPASTAASSAPSTAASTEPSAAASAQATPGVDLGHCSDAAADLSATSTGPNGEESTSASDIPDLTDEQVAAANAAGYKWAYLPSGASTWFNAVGEGAKAEAERLGLTLTVTADSNFDPAKQAADVESAMATDPDIIVTLPVDPTQGAEAFRPAVDAGVKLVFNDNGVDGFTAGEEYVAIVTGDHFGMGDAAADLMSQALPDGGPIGVIFHDADFYVTNNRDCRFVAAVEQNYPELEIVATSGMTEEGATESITSAMLTQHPEIKGIYVTWSAAATGALAALRGADRSDVKVVVHDLDAANDLDMAQNG